MSPKLLLLILAVMLVAMSLVQCEYTLEEITNMAMKYQEANVPLNSIYSNITNAESTEQLIKQVSNLPEYIEMALKNSPANCSSAWNTLTRGKQLVRFSATYNMSVNQSIVAMDACGKPEPELLHGNFHFTGGFDECMEIDTSRYGFGMQYSELGIIFVLVTNNIPLIFPIPMVESVCVPDTCTIEDLNKTFTNINKDIYLLPIPSKVLMFLTGLHVQATQQDIPLPYSTGAIIMIIISFLFVVLVIIGTIYDIILPYYVSFFLGGKLTIASINDMSIEKVTPENSPLLGNTKSVRQQSRLKELLHDLIQSFSLYKNVPAILSTSQPPSAITSINGLRVISMFWVMLGHSFIFLLFSNEYKDILDLYEVFVARFSAQSVVNAYFSVDSFFFLSGLLVAYLTFREMNRNNGRFPFLSFYVHRFLRLTPTYMFVLFFFWLLAVHVTDGPNILDALGESSASYKQCEKYWWTNLLYINNFYPDFGKQCMGWAWYLANDMQFYIISPLFLIPFFYSLPSGLIAISITLLSSIGLTGFIAGYYGYPASELYPTISGRDIPNPQLPNQDTEIYGKPYCRITPYMVGILLGYVLYKKYQIPFSKYTNMLVYALIWMAAIFTGIINVYGLYSSFHGHELSATENVMYFMFSRFTWGATLFLVVFACHNGYGGVVNRFLSMPMWIPLSRLTFNTYLIHEVVLLIINSSMRDGVYFTNIGISVIIIANVVIAFACAFLISVFVEFPLSNVERAMFKVFGKPLRSTARTAGASSKH